MTVENLSISFLPCLFFTSSTLFNLSQHFFHLSTSWSNRKIKTLRNIFPPAIIISYGGISRSKTDFKLSVKIEGLEYKNSIYFYLSFIHPFMILLFRFPIYQKIGLYTKYSSDKVLSWKINVYVRIKKQSMKCHLVMLSWLIPFRIRTSFSSQVTWSVYGQPCIMNYVRWIAFAYLFWPLSCHRNCHSMAFFLRTVYMV